MAGDGQSGRSRINTHLAVWRRLALPNCERRRRQRWATTTSSRVHAASTAVAAAAAVGLLLWRVGRDGWRRRRRSAAPRRCWRRRSARRLQPRANDRNAHIQPILLDGAALTSSSWSARPDKKVCVNANARHETKRTLDKPTKTPRIVCAIGNRLDQNCDLDFELSTMAISEDFCDDILSVDVSNVRVRFPINR